MGSVAGGGWCWGLHGRRSRRFAGAAGRHPLAIGVETPAPLRRVRELGYESLQGYIAGAPAPLIDLRDVISHRRVHLD